jgi:hypothetical protein
MWVAATFTALGLTGTAFMIWFLIGLLGEGRPSTRYWLAVRFEAGKVRLLQASTVIYADDGRPKECERSEYYAKLRENEVYAKHRASGLIALDVRPISTSLGWRSIHPRHGYAFGERGVEFDSTDRTTGNAG